MPAEAATVPLAIARWRLALIWFPCCGLLFLLLVAQSLAGAFGDLAQKAWGWALPNFLPTLALMVGVFAADALRPAGEGGSHVRRGFLILALGLSLFYLAVLLMSLVAPAFAAEAPTPQRRLAVMELSNVWLGPLQSLVVAALSVLFFMKEPHPARPEAGPAPAPGALGASG